jgi:ubiquinone/menaquinone biosynthesis C-methylase UbiE
MTFDAATTIDVAADGPPLSAFADAISTMRQRLVARAATLCAERGWRRIALYGAGRHTRLFIRQPWAWNGVEVVAVVDDNAQGSRVGGLCVVHPRALETPVDAVVVSSEVYEAAIAERAAAVFGSRGIPVLRIYGDDPAWECDETAVKRLVERCGVSAADAHWLVENRMERHDATLPVLPPARTEMHLRRYELAATMAPGKRVLDAACGTGYGSSMLLRQGEAGIVIGVDIDAATIDYARRRFTSPGLEFRTASATRTGLPDASVDLVTSFETIEHMSDPTALLAEFSRVLAPGGRLVLSTPNDWGLTDFHAHSFGPEEFRTLVANEFHPLRWLAQRAGDTPVLENLPPGVFPVNVPGWRAETLMVIAEKK